MVASHCSRFAPNSHGWRDGGLIVLGSIQFFDYYRDREAPADIGKVVRMKVSDSDTNSSFARDLQKKGLIERTWVFEGFAARTVEK